MKGKLKFRTLIILALTISLGFIAEKNLPSSSFQPTNGDDLTIILMIGDGMGFEQVRMGRYVEFGMHGNLTMESSQHQFSVMTHNINLGITDSAAAGTAMAAGIKTNNGRIAMNADFNSVETILEIALGMGKATGVVSTTTIYHATPACFMTHTPSRGNYQEIVRQMVENANVDVILGGGRQEFSDQQILNMEAAGYSYVTNRTALNAVASGRIFGLFSQSNLPYEQDRNYTVTPSIADMTRKAINILQQNSSGFFLMVEGGRIDHASHDNEQVGAVLETIAFDKAVREAKNYVETHENSILIVTADHETGGPTVIGNTLDGTLPVAGLSEEQNRTIRITRANQLEIDWRTGGHTLNHIPMYVFGTAFENIKSNLLIDNTDIFGVMNNFIHNEEIVLIDRTPINMVATYYLYLLVIPLSIILIYLVVKTKRSIKREGKNR